MKVFVSSTYDDLKKHRKAVNDTLQRLQADFTAMEYLGSRTGPPLKACLDEVSQCDILVGIYAWRYGSQPSPDSPSFTEQEFDAAVKLGKVVLLYVVDEHHRWSSAMIDSGPPADRLARFKQKVRGQTVSSFTTPDNLAGRVVADVGREMRAAEAKKLNDFVKAVGRVAHLKGVKVALSDLVVTGELPAEVFQVVGESGHLDANLPRFVGRKEWFGSVVFDRERMDYIPFDQDATDIFALSQHQPLEQIYEKLDDRATRTSLETFVGLCQSIGLLDATGTFTGRFVQDSSTAGRLSAPLTVHLSCTKACNFSCGHCFSSSGRPHIGELSTTRIQDLIDELAGLGCFDLSLGGGEPLIRPDLPEIVGHANTRGVSISISTNAAAATREVVDALGGVKIRGFKISMDAASEKLYDAMRGEPGAFRDALQGIENLRTLRVPISFRTVFMRPNVSELPAIVRLAEQLQVDRLLLTTVMPVGRAAQNPDLLLDWEETNRLWDQAAAIQKSTKLLIHVPHQVPFKGTVLFRGFGCKCGTMVCHVDARGNVAPTGFLKDTMSAGNLKEKSLKQIWDSGASFVQFRSFAGNAQCTACTHFSNCRGGCRARALLMDHDINLPDGNCALTHGS